MGFCVEAKITAMRQTLVPFDYTAGALAKLRQEFDQSDVSGDAILSRAECAAWGDKPKSVLSIACNQFREVDTDRDAHIDFAEVLNVWSPRAARSSGQAAAGAANATADLSALESVQGAQPAGAASGKRDEVRDKNGEVRDKNAKCRRLMGEGAVFDGKESCTCAEGYIKSESRCVLATLLDSECKKMFGAGAFFDGQMCACKPGYEVRVRSDCL